MAQFRGTVEGNRSQASRLGTKNSGLVTSANGWNIGINVCLSHIDGEDHVRVFLTGGSNGRYSDKLIFEAKESDIPELVK